MGTAGLAGTSSKHHSQFTLPRSIPGSSLNAALLARGGVVSSPLQPSTIAISFALSPATMRGEVGDGGADESSGEVAGDDSHSYYRLLLSAISVSGSSLRSEAALAPVDP